MCKFNLKLLIATLVVISGVESSWANGQKQTGSSSSDEVTLIASGTSSSESEAVSMALRSALEQTYGTFVSANTSIFNDELLKDEIVSISTGNVKKYEILSSSAMPNGQQSVVIRAVISKSKLVKYASSHGSSTELAGNTFAMAMKLEEMNTESERKVMRNMISQLYLLLPNLFDYEMTTGEPKMTSTSECTVPISVKVKSNANSVMFQNIIENTLAAVSVREEEKCPNIHTILYNGTVYHLRTKDWLGDFSFLLSEGVTPRIFSFLITDQNSEKIAWVELRNDWLNDKETIRKFWDEWKGMRDILTPGLCGCEERREISDYFEYSEHYGREDYKKKRFEPHINYSYVYGNYRDGYFVDGYHELKGILICTFPRIVMEPVKKKRKWEYEYVSTTLFEFNMWHLEFSRERMERISNLSISPAPYKDVVQPVRVVEEGRRSYATHKSVIWHRRVKDGVTGNVKMFIDKNGKVSGENYDISGLHFLPYKINGIPVDSYISFFVKAPRYKGGDREITNFQYGPLKP